ncbi:MAG: MBL fold metallo-hydrolase [Acidobacteria bacterium]|nr:MBL fold metallo-hydrolase [Acidobacteriota bacterium]
MIVETFVLSPFQQNTRVIVCEKSGRAVCVDPGADSPELVRYLRKNDLTLQAITLTHAHLDHVGGTGALAREFQKRRFCCTRTMSRSITRCPSSRFEWDSRPIN